MTIIPLQMSIHRNPRTKKKFYKSITTEKPTSALLPKNWQTSTDYDSLTYKQTPSYAIRCDDDLVVIDCDDMKTTELINDSLEPSDTNTQHYIVVSDKGEKHYYFSPTEYFKGSVCYHKARKTANKIDILQGKALVFAACEGNETKQVLQGTKNPDSKIGYDLTPIPNNIVDLLSERIGDVATSEDTDYKPLATYLGPQIERALTTYTHHTKGGNYLDLQGIMQLITPSRYKQDVMPDYHPDRVPDGEGMSYLHALGCKIGRDPSISPELHRELITIIAQKLWSEPLSDERLETEALAHMTQRYPSGKPIFVYDSNATNQPLVSINNNEYCPVYRTLDDEYLLAKPNGDVEVIKGQTNFKRAMTSSNYNVLIDGKKVNLDNAIAMKKLNEAMKTVTKRELPYYDTGEYTEEGSSYYNTYRPTKYLGIIRGTYKQDEVYQGPSSHTTITMIIKNVMMDNLLADPNSNTMYNNFLKFLSYKLKTLEHSELVFHLMGERGTGKNKFLAILRYLTDSVIKVNFNASNVQFNEDQATAIFLSEEEGKITKDLQETVKQLSGDTMRRIEGKGKTAFMARSVATYIVSNNDTMPLAQTVDDRRVVTFSSWKATPLDKMPITDIDIKIKLELEAFALCLREQKLTNKKLYLSAKVWHDEIHYTNFEEQAAKAQDLPTRLKLLHERANTKTGEEIHKELTDILGNNYHYDISKFKGIPAILIPLQKSPRLIRQSDKAELTHEITREQLKKVGLDSYCSRNKNKNNAYGVSSYYRLAIKLAPKQLEYFKMLEEGIEDISGDLGDVELD